MALDTTDPGLTTDPRIVNNTTTVIDGVSYTGRVGGGGNQPDIRQGAGDALDWLFNPEHRNAKLLAVAGLAIAGCGLIWGAGFAVSMTLAAVSAFSVKGWWNRRAQAVEQAKEQNQKANRLVELDLEYKELRNEQFKNQLNNGSKK